MIEIARELGIEAQNNFTKVEIMNSIIQSESYEEEIVKAVMEGVSEEKREKMAFEESRPIREFELERMRLTNITNRASVSSEDLEGQGVNRRVNQKDLVSKNDPKNADINLVFEIFERQAKKEKVAYERWFSQLIPLLPMEIVELVVKEPPEKGDNYPGIQMYTYIGLNLHLWPLVIYLNPISEDQLESPLDDVCPCLPLTKIKIKTKRGEFYTLATIRPDGRSDDSYLLGNRTAELIDSSEQGIQLINAVVTRSAGKIHPTEVKKEIISRGQVAPSLKLISPSEGKEEKKFEIPPIEGRKEIILTKINGFEFEVEHKKCNDLKVLWDKTRSGIDKVSWINNRKLIRVTRSKRDQEIRQMCVPLKFWGKISNLSHDEIEGDAKIPYQDK
ncbi:integrase_H2C2 domain-containing protein [Nephila pilipes]|uniref:Integrase_H2C2 domain-containing protein n=1 Tax=Nephila pilipes TaxID=299642 RepID=A0A8X6NHI3_NEPPI|nr:integrase_H2C2 domain-containing protein [Nephila pilipes]